MYVRGLSAIDERAIDPLASPADQAAARKEMERRAAGGTMEVIALGPKGAAVAIDPNWTVWEYDVAVTGRNKWLVLASRPGEILLETFTGKSYSGDMLPGPGQILNVAIQLGVLYAAWKVIRK